MKKESEFRRWCRDTWLTNSAELESYNQHPYSFQEYFQKYKYWLKSEFQLNQRSKKDPDLLIGIVFDDKFDNTGVNLLSDSQNKLLKTLKDSNEKQR